MRRAIWLLVFAAGSVPAILVEACSSDDTSATTGPDGGADQTVPDAGSDAAALVARGDYLVNTLGSCGDCHTPRNADHTLGPALSGNDCFAGGPPDAGPGCLASRNLTNDVTGLKNLSDDDVKAAFQHGKGPTNTNLWSIMPYWVYANLTDEDANAVVAYLRTVPAVNHRVAGNTGMFNQNPPLIDPIDMSQIPTPTKDNNPDYDSEIRGRYIAAVSAACVECHTAQDSQGHPIREKWFAGGRDFPAFTLGLTTPSYPTDIYSANLTQDSEHGLIGHSVDDIVRTIKRGLEKDGGGMCPPMPVGPGGSYGKMTDDDAKDVARYLLTLPGITNDAGVNDIPNGCVAPDAGN